MVAGAAELIARRGVSAASVREVVRSTGTPRGSIAHHFPAGRQQLIEEAVGFAGQAIARPMETLLREHGAQAGLTLFIRWWEKRLKDSHFEVGCPVLAACLEGPVSEDVSVARESGSLAPAEQARLLDVSQAVFVEWQRIFAEALRREGVKPAQARRLAALVIASVEGTVAMCRAARSAKPLDDVRIELELLVGAAVAAVAKVNATTPTRQAARPPA